jgi:type II secretory pathway component GspD/PulD (secretin)
MHAPSTAPSPTDPSYAAQVKALQQVEFQKQRVESLKVQREAQARFSKGETDAAVQLLTDHLAKMRESQLDPADLAMLQRPVEYRLQTFKVLKSQRDAETTLAVQKSATAREHAEKAMEKDSMQKQVADLMKQWRTLMDNGKFDDAMMLAMKAHELDPDDVPANMAVEMSRIQKRVKEGQRLKDAKEEMVLQGLNDTDKEGPYVGIEDPVKFDLERWRLSGHRPDELRQLGTHMRTDREKSIERQLSTPITFDFSGVPLRQVLQDLHSITKLNVVPQLEALKIDGISMDQPVTLKVEAIPLKSALNLLLRQVNLTWVIADDVLQVTTEKGAKGRQVQKVYSVADLVIPIDNYAIPNSANLLKVLDENSKNRGFRLQGAGSATNMDAGQPTGNSSLSTTPGGSGHQMLPGTMAASTNVTLAKNTIEDVLIKLVTNTVSPQTWSDVGGSGTIEYFPIGMALVINQTPDIQEQVAELLAALRRLQDMEVAVEVRIVTVAETFFERIGLDFSMNIKTDHYTTQYEPQITTQQFKPAGYINDFTPHNFIAGLTPAGTFTHDLDIPIASTSFNRAIPPFGYPNSPGNNGGLSLGLAFLNDIQVFMFMEAAQGDNRTNVMQAPKLTLFNGQTSTILIQDFQFFVTDVAVVSVNGQLVFVPNNVPFPVGPAQTAGNISLAIQAVVSADRRYVRLNMNPQLQNLGSATVPLFPVTVFITPQFEGGFQGQPIPFTQFIQQPKFSSVNVSTTVAVPDGGTVLLGGLKHLSEGRNESGPPVLSKIPYVNRLFKNTGYGREAESMMIMVTPRIIINAEESERQTGQVEYEEK